jgi:hypothetical protein
MQINGWKSKSQVFCTVNKALNSAPKGYKMSEIVEHGIKPFYTTLNQSWGTGYIDKRRIPSVSPNNTTIIF